MNERLTELYNQANTWTLNNYSPPVNPFVWDATRNGKFAELIILECGRIADDEDWISNTRALKEHFGMKEV